MGTFKKKPVEIQAFQLGVDYIPDWAMNEISKNNIVLHKENPCEYSSTIYADIVTPEGTMRANHGDYIIQGVNGEVYPCKEDIFKKTYDSINVETEKDKFKKLFVEAISCDNKVILYTIFDEETIECCIYVNNLGEVFDTFDARFDDNLESIGGTCRIVEVVAVESLAEYFSDSYQEKISNRIYEKTGIRI